MINGHPIFELWNPISQRNQQILQNRFFLFSCGPYLHRKTQNYPVEGCSKRIPHLGLHHVHGHVLFKKHRFESPFQMRILQPVKYLRHFRCEATVSRALFAELILILDSGKISKIINIHSQQMRFENSRKIINRQFSPN